MSVVDQLADGDILVTFSVVVVAFPPPIRGAGNIDDAGLLFTDGGGAIALDVKISGGRSQYCLRGSRSRCRLNSCRRARP